MFNADRLTKTHSWEPTKELLPSLSLKWHLIRSKNVRQRIASLAEPSASGRTLWARNLLENEDWQLANDSHSNAIVVWPERGKRPVQFLDFFHQPQKFVCSDRNQKPPLIQSTANDPDDRKGRDTDGWNQPWSAFENAQKFKQGQIG